MASVMTPVPRKPMIIAISSLKEGQNRIETNRVTDSIAQRRIYLILESLAPDESSHVVEENVKG